MQDLSAVASAEDDLRFDERGKKSWLIQGGLAFIVLNG